MHDDEAITDVLRAVFDRFAEMGSARQVWLWLRRPAWTSAQAHAPSAAPSGASCSPVILDAL
jgi:hypothetical protein